MNSRERVTRAIEFSGPDRIPVMHSHLIGAFLRYGDRLRALYREFPSDVSIFGYDSDEEYGLRAREGSRDAWGSVWMRLGDEYKGQVVGHPLADWSDLETYQFPDPLAGDDFARVEKAVQEEQHQRYVLVDGGTLFQRMFYLRGFENLMADFLTEREKVCYLRDRIADYMLARLHRWFSLDIDGFIFRDDWGTQTSLMVSPALWRELFKPTYKKLFDAIRDAGAHIHFHSDGYIRAIIPDLIEIGVDVLNPQLATMDIAELGWEFGGKVCVRGGLDRQHILPHGTPEEVEVHARQVAAAFGRFNGGYIGAGQIGPDVPLENARRMLETFVGIKYQGMQEQGAS